MKYSLILFCFTFSLYSLACKPCASKDYKHIYKSADLVLVGSQLGSYNSKKPLFTDIQIHNSLKNTHQFMEQRIRVPAYLGMCPYGLIIPKAKTKFLIFLRFKSNKYEMVSCQKPLLEVKNDFIELDGLSIKLEKALNRWQD